MENVMNGNIQAGNNIGDITIVEGNNRQYVDKPYDMCTSDELREDKQYRRELISKENTRKNKTAFNILKVLIITVPILIIWYLITGPHIALIIIALFGVVIPVAGAFRLFSEDNEFITIQREAIKLIGILLKQRGEE